MYSFFVLGIIPGTNLQITFQDWIGFITVLAGVFLLRRAHRQHRPTAHLAVLQQIIMPYTLTVQRIAAPVITPMKQQAKIAGNYVLVKLLLLYSRTLMPAFSESFGRLNGDENYERQPAQEHHAV